VTALRAAPAAAPRRDRRRSAAAALAAGVVAAALLHLGLAVAAEASRLVRDPVYADKERKLARLERALPPGSPVVVFVGTSRTGNGFDAGRAQELLTDALGRPAGAFNFGTPASGPVTHLLHLRRLLAGGHRPALLVLEILPPTLAELPDGPLEGRFAGGAAFGWDELDWAAGYGFPVERLREQRRKAVVAPWYGLRFQVLGRLFPTALPYHLRYDWSRGPDQNGWNPMLVEEVDDAQRAAGFSRAKLEYRDILAGLKLGAGPTRALRDLLELCRERGIPVVLVRMPEGSGFRALYPRGVAARVERFLGELAGEFRCRVADCREWMPDDAFADGHHLLRGPAGAFTERLTREVIEPALRFATGGGTP
jgi:hypothetical protein